MNKAGDVRASWKDWKIILVFCWVMTNPAWWKLRKTDLTLQLILSVDKKPVFTVDERVEMIRQSTKKFKNVRIDHFNGLVVDYAGKVNASVIIRGLRAVSDFEFEFQMALTNRQLNEKVDTVFLMPHVDYTYLSSSTVREIAKFGGDVSRFVPRHVKNELYKKLKG